MSGMLLMSDLDLAGKRVLIREDLNVPLKDGLITDDSRIQRALPTIRQAIKANARVIIMSHLGRPKVGELTAETSLAPVAKALTQALEQPVELVSDWLSGVSVAPAQVVLCENVRLQPGERENDDVLAQKIAALCDIYVMDAFATAHRDEASTSGVAEYAPIACAGPLLAQELQAINCAMSAPKKPVVAIVGGSKVSTKLPLLSAMLPLVDVLIVGGGIANTLLAASGCEVGSSLVEKDYFSKAKALLAEADRLGVDIPLPCDVCVASELSADAVAHYCAVDQVSDDRMILDVGSRTSECYAKKIAQADTIIWNGPVGVYELPQFAAGTKALAEAVAQSSAYSLAGGGDTLAALVLYEVTDKISYVSTGGGAFLSVLQGEALPAVMALNKRGKND